MTVNKQILLNGHINWDHIFVGKLSPSIKIQMAVLPSHGVPRSPLGPLSVATSLKHPLHTLLAIPIRAVQLQEVSPASGRQQTVVRGHLNSLKQTNAINSHCLSLPVLYLIPHPALAAMCFPELFGPFLLYRFWIWKGKKGSWFSKLQNSLSAVLSHSFIHLYHYGFIAPGSKSPLSPHPLLCDAGAGPSPLHLLLLDPLAVHSCLLINNDLC